MNDPWQYFRKLFSETEYGVATPPVIEREIIRSPEEVSEYENWKSSPGCYQSCNWLMKQYLLYGRRPSKLDEAIDFINTPSTRGFILHLGYTEFNKAEITHWFDYFKDRLIHLGYQSYLSDTRIYLRPDWMETHHRHYLKPDILFTGMGCKEPCFDNIQIDLLFKQDFPVTLKFTAIGSEELLSPGGGVFGELMRHLLLGVKSGIA